MISGRSKYIVETVAFVMLRIIGSGRRTSPFLDMTLHRF